MMDKVGKGDALVDVKTLQWVSNERTPTSDVLIEEVPVAFIYNGISHVVMMATPVHLEDFALGFSLTEGIIRSVNELRDIQVTQTVKGIELHLDISSRRLSELKQRRRNMTGRTGCGLCGAESLEAAIRPVNGFSTLARVSELSIQQATRELENYQPLQQKTGACHGAAWCNMQGQIVLAREDIGRHNALDKLVGTLANGSMTLTDGFALISSRASYEMVHKAVSAGIQTLVAVSAPTSLAVRLAKEAKLNLIGFARPNRHVYYSE